MRVSSHPSSSEANFVFAAVLRGEDLIDGNAGMNIGARGLLRMDAGEIASAGAGVIAAAIAQRVAGVMVEAADDADVVMEIGDRVSGCA